MHLYLITFSSQRKNADNQATLVNILKSLKAEFTINRRNSHCAAACLSASVRLQSHIHTALTHCKNVTFTI